MLLVNRARMEGFVVFDYAREYPEAIRQLGQWVKEGKIKYAEDVVEGIENAPKYLNMLFQGANKGKLIVKLADHPTQHSRL
jgi:NADPH-dependent curcumin reductase CurA